MRKSLREFVLFSTHVPLMVALGAAATAVTTNLVHELVTTRKDRTETHCGSKLRSVEHRVTRARHVDALRVDAFHRALLSVCT